MLSTTRARRDQLSDLDPTDVVARWHDRRLDELTDGELVAIAGRHLSRPRGSPGW